MFKRVSIVLVALMLFLVAGCSKAPEAEMQGAETAMQTAMTAEAEQYAPQAYQMAMDTMNAAKAAKEEQDSKFAMFRSYGKSKDMYMSASTLAERAATEASAEKERVRVEVMNQVTVVQAVIDSATAALAKAPTGKGTKADIEMIKNDLASVTLAFEEAKRDIEAEKFLVAKAKLDAVATKARSIIAEIEAARAKRAG